MTVEAGFRQLARIGFSCLLAVGVAAAASPDQLPDVTSGKPVSLRAEGDVLHVVFFAARCPPCVEELEPLRLLHDRWGEDGYRLVLVGVSHRQSADRPARFASSNRAPGALVHDTAGALQTALAADGVPAHVVFGPDGAEVARAGSFDSTIEETVPRLLVAARGARR